MLYYKWSTCDIILMYDNVIRGWMLNMQMLCLHAAEDCI